MGSLNLPYPTKHNNKSFIEIKLLPNMCQPLYICLSCLYLITIPMKRLSLFYTGGN